MTLKKRKREKFVWGIEKYRGLEVEAQHTIPAGQITEENVKNLLRTLTAKYWLTDDEIIPNFLKRNTKIYWDYLEVQTDSKARFHTLRCLGKAQFMAMRVPETELSWILRNKQEGNNKGS